MKSRTLVLVLAAAVVGAGLLAGGAYQLGRQHGDGHQFDAAAQAAPADGRRVLYWHDPMVPGQRFDKPGKSPFMDMQLVPVYADDGADDGSVRISSRVQQNLGVRTAEVVRGELGQQLEAVGNVLYNEREQAVVQARSNGFVEKLHVRATLDRVRRGQPVVDIVVPEWVAAQEEYLGVLAMQGNGMQAVAEAARQRMLLAGMSEAQIAQVEKTRRVHARATITAPISGVVTELDVREGMAVGMGMPLFRINGIDSVWIVAELPEAVAARVRPGQAVEARATALPGEIFKGKVGTLLPDVSASTRTVRARIEVANRDARLVPGMFANIRFSTETRRNVLLVPTEAVIATGTRTVVLVAGEEGRFSAVDVEPGAEVNGQTEIVRGLEAGQKVVVSGQFMIDSESSLKGSVARMNDAPAADLHHADGVVEDIDADEVMLSHGPVPSLQWGEMTMAFRPPKSGMPAGVKEGDSVRFSFRQTRDGQFEIVSIALAGRAGSGGAPR